MVQATLNVTLTQISTTNYNANINVLDGSVNVNSGSNGSYTIVYEICQIDNITNCATATVNGDIFTSAIVATNDLVTLLLEQLVVFQFQMY
jgi:hypothetical protein